MDKKSRFPYGIILTGSIFIFIGIFWIMKNLGYLNFSLREWWPLILIVVGLLNILNQRNILSFPGWLLVLLGSAFLLTTNDIIEWESILKFWPAILIFTGLSLLFETGKKKSKSADMDEKDNYISGFAVFSGFNRKVTSKSFRGGNIFAMFGGSEIDLREAKLNPDGAVMEITAIFGGIELRIPDGWDVEVSSTALFGGVENKYRSENSGEDKPVRINAVAIFGGVEIKN